METPQYNSMMSSSSRYGLDGPTDQYHKHLAHSQSTKDHTQLENINKFFDKCKEQKLHNIALEERELKKSLKKLERERQEHKRQGYAVDKTATEDEKKKKGVVVKLQPGKIDFERMSPPSSHDVAVRMLFDKKGQGKKKKLKKKSDHLGGPEALETSFSHKEASVALPALSDEETTSRSYSMSGPESDNKLKLKGSKSKKRIKKKAPVIHVPSQTSPDRGACQYENMETSSSAAQMNDLRSSSSELSKKTGPPKIPFRAWSGISDSIDEEMVKTTDQGSKLPHLPTKFNLIETTVPEKDEEHPDPKPFPAKNRRASLDYRDLDYLKGTSSFTPGSSIMHRRASVGGPHDVTRPMRMHEDHKGSANKRKSTKKLDIYMLDHYYALLSDTQKILKEEDPNFALPHNASKHLPLCTLKRSQRRKTMALEVLLKQLPGYKKTEIEPKDILNCRYLRLSRNNIESLEEMCRQEGHDPGLHPHMTQEEVEEYFEQLDRQDESDTESEIELLCGGTANHIYH